MSVPSRVRPSLLAAVCFAFAADALRAADAAPAPPIDSSELKRGACGKDQLESDRGCVTLPQLRKKVQPRYPKAARKAGVQGQVTARATIDVDGKVTDVTIVACDPKDMGFEGATIDAVRQWEYSPATIEGRPVAVLFIVKTEFELSKTSPQARLEVTRPCSWRSAA